MMYMGHISKAGQKGWRYLYRAAMPGGHSKFAQY